MNSQNKGRNRGNGAASQTAFTSRILPEEDPLLKWHSLAASCKARMKRKGARHGKR
jgi:hypothetical protein